MRLVLLLWHDQTPIGICIFGFGPLSSSARNRFFGLGGRLTKSLADRINRNFASVVRLVIDPRYRGVGIAAAFLRRCCQLAPWPWIELISEMANLVPFAESAGFRRVGISKEKHLGEMGFPGGPPRRSAGRRRRGPGHYGKSGWTDEGFAAYCRKVRFSRPAYYIFDNRDNAAQAAAGQ